MRWLAVGAHPDDLEILCAGTLFRLVREGHHVELAVATDGSGGWKPPAEMRAMRRAEAEAAAAILGAPLHWLGARDELLSAEDEGMRLAAVDLVRRTRPDAVITHFPGDYHPDHRAAAGLLFAATFVASVDSVATVHPVHRKVPALYYCDTLAGVGFEPEVYVDISATFADKRRMLAAHGSQLEWLRRHDGIDVLELMEAVARFRGFQAGVAQAEAFRRERAWPRAAGSGHLPG